MLYIIGNRLFVSLEGYEKKILVIKHHYNFHTSNRDGKGRSFSLFFFECIRYQQLNSSLADGFCSEIALFAFQVALGKTWQKLGINSTQFCGYGVGEYSAACVLSSVRIPDTLRILHARRESILQNLDTFVSKYEKVKDLALSCQVGI